MRNQKGYQTITASQADALRRSGEAVILVDVREPEERRAGFIPGSLSIPAGQLERLAPRMLPNRNAKLLVYCQTGSRSWLAAGRLCEMGYTRVYDMGGYLSWKLSACRRRW